MPRMRYLAVILLLCSFPIFGTPNDHTTSYIVLLNHSGIGHEAATAKQLVSRYGGRVESVWTRAVHGFAASLTTKQMQSMRSDARVAAIEVNGRIIPAAT